MEWPRPDTPTPEIRAWKLREQQGLAAFCDFVFRVVEMVLIVVGVRFVELKIGAGNIVSTLLTALLVIFVRGKAMAATLPAIERYEVSEARRIAFYWLFWAMSLIVFLGAYFTVNLIVPLLVVIQR